MIRFLEELELCYPQPCHIPYLLKKLKINIKDKELLRAIAYLHKTKKIEIVLSDTRAKIEYLADLTHITEATICPEGMELLEKSKIILTNEERTEATTKATVVLAFVGFIQALVLFQQFSEEVNNIWGWLTLLIIGILLILLFNIAWDSLSHVFSKKIGFFFNFRNKK